MSVITTTPGILLRSHPYSESSKILRFLTPGHGLVSVIGKGVRSRSHRAEAPVETFAEGVLTYSFRPDRDLHSLRDFRQGDGSLALGREVQRFVGASLWAELLLSHTLEGADEQLYEWVRASLIALARVPGDEVPGWILAGAWRILAHLGFPPELDLCVRCGEALMGLEEAGGMGRFDVAGGGMGCSACIPEGVGPRIGPGALDQLRGFVTGESNSSFPGARAHLSLLEAFSTYHLGRGKEFHSFGMLRSLWMTAATETS